MSYVFTYFIVIFNGQWHSLRAVYKNIIYINNNNNELIEFVSTNLSILILACLKQINMAYIKIESLTSNNKEYNNKSLDSEF